MFFAIWFSIIGVILYSLQYQPPCGEDYGAKMLLHKASSEHADVDWWASKGCGAHDLGAPDALVFKV